MDEWGNNTGSWKIVYTDPIKATANISGSRGTSEAEVFGINAVYDRVIAMMSTDMTEESILWIDREPELEPDGTLTLASDGRLATPHNHIIKQISRSLNSVLLAVQRVSVS
jgi:hypothetical protein